jgi:hypothetical protein
MNTRADRISEPTLVTAAINNLGVLVKTRPPLGLKVLSAVMTFNPFTRKQLTVKSRLMMLSMEKTIRVLLMNIVRFVRSRIQARSLLNPLTYSVATTLKDRTLDA